MKEELGDEWLKPELFRLGASTLLGDIERQVGFRLVRLKVKNNISDIWTLKKKQTEVIACRKVNWTGLDFLHLHVPGCVRV